MAHTEQQIQIDDVRKGPTESRNSKVLDEEVLKQNCGNMKEKNKHKK